MIALLVGGANSGKSALAERWVATRPGPVTYVATWDPDEHDGAMAVRVAAHRARRPPAWRTVEVVGDALVSVVGHTAGTLLVDSLGPWLAAAPGFAVDTEGLCRALAERSADVVVVSDEVGLGVHPSTEAGRAFREALGALNLAVAAVADEAWLVVAGRLVALAGVAW